MSKDRVSAKADTSLGQAGGGLKRRDLLLSGSSLVAASALSAVGLTSPAQAQQPMPAPAGQPNIVVIMGDDIGI
jgi:arylsulfatase